jgi:hypothetical protein
MTGLLHAMEIVLIGCGIGALLLALNPKFEPECPGFFMRWRAFLMVYCIPAAGLPLLIVVAMIRLGLVR